jgi:hypothetical protein
VECSCEHSNEPSGSIKCWEVLAQLAASQEGLSSMGESICLVSTGRLVVFVVLWYKLLLLTE